MKNKGSKHIQLLFVLVSILQFSTFAQSPKYFIISGKIVSDIENSENISVQIIKNNKPAIAAPIESNGRFRLELDYNAEYRLTFKQANHISKTIVVNTGIPKDVLQMENIPHFLMAVNLEKTFADTDIINTETAVQHIIYSPHANNFVKVSTNFDVEYAEGNVLNDKQIIRLADNKSKNQGYKIF